MSQTEETFFTSVGCIDGRVQEPVAEFGRKRFTAKFADTITEAGLVGALSRLQSPEALATGGQAKQSIDKNLFSSLKRKIFISLDKHHSKGIIIHGHQECAGNPVDEAKHKKDILKTAELIQSLIPKNTPMVPVFVKRENGNWIAEEL